MSSPVSRRSKRSSVAGTPARSRTSQQQNGSSPAAARSTPQQQRTGPNVSMSSPLFFGSSPANGTPSNSNASRGPASSIVDNDSTPRGRGRAAGGMLSKQQGEIIALIVVQNHRQFDTCLVLVQQELLRLMANGNRSYQPAAAACSYAHQDRQHQVLQVLTTRGGQTYTPMSSARPLVVEGGCLSTRTACRPEMEPQIQMPRPFLI